jgi:hypothetical protein
MKKGLKTIAWVLMSLTGVGLLGAAVVTVVVERESRYTSESLGGAGPRRALILYHPSRDAHFSEEISAALAEGFKSAGLRVDRATLTRETPSSPAGYDVIAVVSNTFWSMPDLPTLRYLKRARWEGVLVVGLICGSGSTDQSERILAERLRLTGARLLGTHSYWIMRPNDESRMQEPNRQVARDLARQFGSETGRSNLAGNGKELSYVP